MTSLLLCSSLRIPSILQLHPSTRIRASLTTYRHIHCLPVESIVGTCSGVYTSPLHHRQVVSQAFTKEEFRPDGRSFSTSLSSLSKRPVVPRKKGKKYEDEMKEKKKGEKRMGKNSKFQETMRKYKIRDSENNSNHILDDTNVTNQEKEEEEEVKFPRLRSAYQFTHLTEILSGNAHCTGCGAKLQTTEKSHAGFVDPKAIETFVKEEEICASVEKKLEQNRKKLAQKKKLKEKGKYSDNQRSNDTNHDNNDDDDIIIPLPELTLYDKLKTKGHVIVCARCHRLKNYNTPTVASDSLSLITPEDYTQELEKLRAKPNLLIIKIIDMFNPEPSIIPNFGKLIGPKHPVILVGNKIDLIPKNAYYERIEAWMSQMFRKYGANNGKDPVNIVSRVLVSSLNGINMRGLAAKIERLREGKDVYIVGTTNVGKSTFINKLLHVMTGTYQTDFKPEKLKFKSLEEAKSEIENAGDEDQNPEKKSFLPLTTTSSLPGTTLRKIAYLMSSKTEETDLNELPQKETHLYDTPGIPLKNLPVNYLDDPKCFKYIYPPKKINPTHIRMRPGKTLFIGGLVRIDYVNNDTRQDWNRVFFSIYASHYLSNHTTKTQNADELYQKHLGGLLSPPFQKESPLSPLEKSYTFEISSKTRMKSACDLAISGLGWIAITGVGNISIKVTVPKVLDVILREPPIMPFEMYKLPKTKFKDA